MKRLALLFSVIFLAACASSEPVPTELVIDVPQSKQEMFAGVIQQFESDTGLTVNLIDSSSSASLSADLIFTDSTALDLLIEQSRVVEIEDNLADGLLSGALSTFSRGGALYGIPFNFETVSLLCHKDKVSSQPQSWENLLELGFIPTYTPGNAFESLFYLSSFQPNLVSSGSLIIDEAQAEAFSGWLASQKPLFRVEDYSLVIEEFASKKSSCLVAGPWMASPMSDFDLVSIKMPQISSTPHRSPALSLGLALSANGQNPEGAKRFLKLLASSEAQRDIYEVTGVLPATAAFSSDITNPLLRALLQGSQEVFPVPNLSNAFVELVALEQLITDSLGSDRDFSTIYSRYMKKLGEG